MFDAGYMQIDAPQYLPHPLWILLGGFALALSVLRLSVIRKAMQRDAVYRFTISHSIHTPTPRYSSLVLVHRWSVFGCCCCCFVLAFVFVPIARSFTRLASKLPFFFIPLCSVIPFCFGNPTIDLAVPFPFCASLSLAVALCCCRIFFCCFSKPVFYV